MINLPVLKGHLIYPRCHATATSVSFQNFHHPSWKPVPITHTDPSPSSGPGSSCLAFWRRQVRAPGAGRFLGASCLEQTAGGGIECQRGRGQPSTPPLRPAPPRSRRLGGSGGPPGVECRPPVPRPGPASGRQPGPSPAGGRPWGPCGHTNDQPVFPGGWASQDWPRSFLPER